MAMDEIDEKLINLLKENSRASYIELAEKVGLSEAAVRRRVKILVEKGIIKKFTIQIGMEQGANALTLIAVSPSIPTTKVSERLKSIKGVQTVYEITGQYDVAALLSAPNIPEINRCVDEIRKVEGVANTNTIIILRILE
jgi:DNA-binding Lrp family transcriptional regulator